MQHFFAKKLLVSKIIPIMAKFVWNGSEFTLLVKEKIKANNLKKIKAVIDENADLIIKRWEEHFNS